MPWSILFLALSGYVASLLTLAVHEGLGHGGVSQLAGGRFIDFYLNPLGGSANTVSPQNRDLLVTAAGPMIPVLAGLVASMLVTRRLRLQRGILLTTFLWLFACEALLDSLGYMTFEPVMAAAAGLDTGDWLRVSRELRLPLWLLPVTGIAVMAPVAAYLMRDARTVVARLGWDRLGRGPGAFWILLTPGVLALLLYQVALLPWTEQPVLLALGNVLGVPLVGTLGLLLPARLRDPEPPREAHGPPNRTSLARWCALLAVTAFSVGWTFGPTTPLRRGVSLGAPDSDDYVAAAQDIRLDVDLGAPSTPRAVFTSRPRPERGSRFRREVTATLAAMGPSREGAARLSRFVAEWNLDGLDVVSVTEPNPDAEGWTWEAQLAPWPDSAMLRLWPLTWVRESRIEWVRVAGGDLRTDLPTTGLDGGAVVWTRPDAMTSVDSFYVVRQGP